MIKMATVNMTVKLVGMDRVTAILNVLSRIPWLFLPFTILVGSRTTAEMVSRFLMWAFVDLEVVT